jgi:PAS domain S-box-containing protein
MSTDEDRHMTDSEKTREELLEELDSLRSQVRRQGSEETYRIAVEKSLAGIAIAQQGRFVFVNSRLAEIAGRAKEELLGCTLWEFVHPDYREFIRDRAERRERGESEPEHYEFPALRKDGSTMWLELQAARIEFMGRPAVLANAIDITERKEAEMALRSREEKYRLLAENTSDVIFVQDTNLELTYVSPSVERLSGYTVDEALKMGMEEFLTPDSFKRATESFQKEFARAMEDVSVTQSPLMEYEYIRKDGSSLWGELKMEFLRDHSGNITGMQGTLRDITERRNVERELLLKNKAVESSINAIAMATPSGDLIYVNPAFLRLWGYAHDREVLGRPSVDFWQSREDASRVIDVLLEKEGWIGELVAQKKDGTNFYVEVSSNLVKDDAGRPSYMVGSFLDITSRKEALEALVEREKELKMKTRNLEEANTALKVLLERREEEKIEIGEKLQGGLQKLVNPYVEKIERSASGEVLTYLQILKSNLEEVLSPFRGTLSSSYADFTASEIEVAELIRHGKTNKDIAALLNISADGVAFHRKNIRKKLGLVNRKVNLRAHLLSIATKRQYLTTFLLPLNYLPKVP